VNCRTQEDSLGDRIDDASARVDVRAVRFRAILTLHILDRSQWVLKNRCEIATFSGLASSKVCGSVKPGLTSEMM
jgi:hypothetical protein